MSELTVPEYILVGSAIVVGWVTVDFLSNLLLMKKEKGCRLRFIGARWLRRKQAIGVAFLQFGLAFGLSFFVGDFFSKLFLQAFTYLLPIGFTTIGILYLYIIGNLPYKITLGRCSPSIFLFAVAGLFFFVIFEISQGQLVLPF